uniref:Cytochrome c biogenesis protein CcsA n=1 Tax=Microglena monadina TaxID=47904 RepID=A0A0S2IB96_9CHLO|nr:heme attachment to plastid cytochrome c [Microglena monadina]
MHNNIEISLANFSFFTLFISMIFYWIETSQFGKNIISNQVLKTQPNKFLTINNNLVLNYFSFLNNNKLNSLIISNNFFFKNFNFGIILMLISNFCIFLILILRWKESGHFPLSNLYESLMFLSWSLTSLHIFIELGTFNFIFNWKIIKKSLINSTSFNLDLKPILEKNFNQKKFFITKLIGSITSPCALFTNAFASFSLPSEMQEASPLVPALQSNWLMMHVTVMILSYAALILGSLLSIGFLVITGGKDIDNKKNLINNNYFLNSTSFEKLSERSLALSFVLDNLSYRILGIGFPLLTIGILSGAVWANEAWGSYWSWDPKETWALLTWLVFAIYLHMRLTKGWSGKKPALIASIGFITVWICYLGVNLIGEGLHSYGWLS